MLTQSHLAIEELTLDAGEEWEAPVGMWHCIRISRGAAYWLGPKRPLSLAESEMLVIPTGVHGVLLASRIGAVQFHEFKFASDILCGLLSLSERHFFETAGPNGVIEARLLPSTHPVTRHFAELIASPRPPGSLAGRIELLRLVAAVFDQEIDVNRPPPTLGTGALARFNELIGEMPETELIRHSPRQLASFCGCSMRHLNRLFRNRFGASARERQTELRLVWAKQLLTGTEQQIQQIAVTCGYRNVSLFNSLFKRRFGMTPTDLRSGLAPATSISEPPPSC